MLEEINCALLIYYEMTIVPRIRLFYSGKWMISAAFKISNLIYQNDQVCLFS